MRRRTGEYFATKPNVFSCNTPSNRSIENFIFYGVFLYALYNSNNSFWLNDLLVGRKVNRSVNPFVQKIFFLRVSCTILTLCSCNFFNNFSYWRLHLIFKFNAQRMYIASISDNASNGENVLFVWNIFLLKLYKNTLSLQRISIHSFLFTFL